MTLRTLAATIAVSTFALTGCGYSCESYCEDRAECPGAASAANCERSCDDLERRNDDFGCTGVYEELVGCLGDLEDVCDEEAAEKVCGDESDAWGDCIVEHCEREPDAPRCQGTE